MPVSLARVPSGQLQRAQGELLHRLFGDPRPRQALGRYRIDGELGRGGMGIVYRAWDPQLERAVAIKLLSGLDGRATAQEIGQLRDEAKAMARVAHPNVLAVFDVGVEDGVPFVVMELVDGGTFTEWLAARRRSPREVVAALLQAGRGLAAAHACGVLHRDFKPGNVLVDQERMRVADFGLAVVGGWSRSATESGDPLPPTMLPPAGTPAFMPPEQHEHASLDERADVYAFCATAHLALCGALPFRGSPMSVLLAEGEVDDRCAAPKRTCVDPRGLRRHSARGTAPASSEATMAVDAGTCATRCRQTQRPTVVGPTRRAVGALVVLLRARWRGGPRSRRRPVRRPCRAEPARACKHARRTTPRPGWPPTTRHATPDPRRKDAIFACLHAKHEALLTTATLLEEVEGRRNRAGWTASEDPAECMRAEPSAVPEAADIEADLARGARARARRSRGGGRQRSPATRAGARARAAEAPPQIAGAGLMLARLESRLGHADDSERSRGNEALLVALEAGLDAA